MAAVLEKLMTGEVMPTDVVDWLLQRNGESKQGVHSSLDYPDIVRISFVQHFINHLRTQSMELTFHGQTVFASPAGKANKLFKALQEQSKSGAKTPRGGGPTARSKVNLFQSPASSADLSDISVLDGSFSSLDVSGSFSERGHHRQRRENTSRSSSDGDARSNRSFERFPRNSNSNHKSKRKNRKVRTNILERTTPERGDLSRHNTTSPDPCGNFSLDSLNDFPSIGSNDSLSMTPRRITPTAVSTPVTAWSEHSSFGDRHSSHWPNIPEAELGVTPTKAKTPTLEAERSMLRRLKSGKDSIHVGNAFSPQSPRENPKRVSICDVNEVVPVPSKVTCQQRLGMAVDLYSRLLQDLLVPNIWMELYFLIQLLTVRGSVSGSNGFPHDEEDHYLSTVHNAVHFAVEVLNNQRRYFSLLDKATLKLLIDSDVIERFKPSFQEELMGFWENSSSSLLISIKHDSMLSSVPFHVETDNRENFPSDRSFHSFKKQRDKFYELLREWQSHHSKPGWSIHTSIAGRIRDLVRIASDSANFYHFAKLFTSQLIRMCQEDPHQSAEAPESLLLNNLKMENPDKLKRLEERFTTPAAVLGPCPPPQFNGCQEFFRSFIIEADSYTLNHHLMDCISTRIKELNKFSYPSDQRDVTSQLPPDKELKEQFMACLHTLQILAKFLGLIRFLPYKQSNGKLTEKLREEIVAGREKVHHQLDVVSCLLAGFRSRRLILVIPWLVEYFSMMDSDAPSLDYYSTAIKHLGAVYRIVGSSKHTEFPLGNQFLLLLLIGWLFEVQSLTPDLLSPATFHFHGDSDSITETPLDHIPLVDQSFLYSCCPYLSDIKGLLSEAAVTSPMRKITPVAADVITQPTNHSPESLTAQIQLDLERNFFNTQSQSMKKSVDFVAGRVASNCIKHIDAVLLLNRRKALASQMMALFQNTSRNEGGDGGEFKKTAQEATDEACKLTIMEADKTAKTFAEKKCKVLIQHILTEDASIQLLQTMCAIAVRNSLQKVRKWIYLQIPGAFKQELESSLQKCLKLQTTKSRSPDGDLGVPGSAENRCDIPPSTLLQELKDTVLCLLTTPPRDTLANDLHNLISSTKSVLLGRQDLTHTTLSSIEHLVRDLFTLTCTISPKSITTPARRVETPSTNSTTPPGPSPPRDSPYIKVQYPRGGPSTKVQSPLRGSPSTEIISPPCNVRPLSDNLHPASDDRGALQKPSIIPTAVGEIPPYVVSSPGVVQVEVGLSHVQTPPDRTTQCDGHTVMVSHDNSVPRNLVNNNSEDGFGWRCGILGCPFFRQSSQPPGKLCLLHEFMEVIHDHLGCKLSPDSLSSARSGAIVGAHDSDVFRIYKYLSKVLNDEEDLNRIHVDKG